MSNQESRKAADTSSQGLDLATLPDGAGCYEIWEHLSELRERSACD